MKRINDKKTNRQWAMTALTAAVMMALTPTLSQAAANGKPIGDLEIYAPAVPGTATIFMMLDVSGSMDVRSIRADYGSACANSGTIGVQRYGAVNAEQILAVVRNPDGTVNQSINFKPRGCKIGDTYRFDRLSRLQKALIELLANEVYRGNTIVPANRVDDDDKGSVADNYDIGLGVYSFNGNGRTGVVLVPTGKLTAAQRSDLINRLNGLTASGNTPTAHALAESGAYMMGTNTRNGGSYDNYSGFINSVGTAKNAGGTSYKSPLNTTECSGNGIYLLTDGEPNASSFDIATNVMNTSLQGSNLSLDGTCNALPGSSSRAWGCMADYTRALRNPANPGNLPIKTATVGFGKTFAGLTGTREIVVGDKTKNVIDCNSGSATLDARNLCKLGERRGDKEVKTFGDGGFYYTEESPQIANSIVDFASSLVQVINAAPSGTITVPNDPYRAASQQAYAYLPMLDPDVASTASIWGGNLKKYSLDQGTLFGRNNSALYKNLAGDLEPTTQDLWQTSNLDISGVAANNDIKAGGVYAKLKTPLSGVASVRTLYVEDFAAANSTKPILRKLSVDAAGKAVGFNELIDTATYTQLNKRRLLSFLGFDGLVVEGVATTPTNVEDLTLAPPAKEIKVLGGVVHSKPTAVSYGADLDAQGRITANRDDYVLFGSMDGALHLVDDKQGEETFAIVPKSMLQAQPEALVDDSNKANVGEPYFGIDAPWLVTSNYNYDLPNKKVKIDSSNGKGVFAYGGMRMGGEAFYGMDLTKKSDPKIKFTITPTGLNNAVSNDFIRLGQTWSKPTAARIRVTASAEPIDVLIFGGGYDMQYEREDYVPTPAAPARGNAIYMINAKTGALVASVSTTGSSSNNANMIHSIVGEVTALDRDGDGLTDHIYAADLGGQVFRVDFQNARNAEFGFAASATASIKRVTRILNTAPNNAADKKYAYRFYERPIVSFYRNSSTGANNGQLFALVNVISGNRSAPLSKLRDDNKYANRVYGIIDNDVTKTDLFATPTLGLDSVTESDLVDLATTLGRRPDDARKNLAKAGMIAGTKKGWYYPLTRFDGFDRVRYNKGVGDSVVINSLLYTTVYNPDKQYGNPASCAAKIAGGSERQNYCLPYGVCMDPKAISGTGGFTAVGQGIQELTLGAINADNPNVQVLIGTRTLSEIVDPNNRTNGGDTGLPTDPNSDDPIGAGAGGGTGVRIDPTSANNQFGQRFTLQPKVWFERQQ